MGFEDVQQPEQNQEKIKLRKNIQALILQGASLESAAELLGAEQFLIKEQGRGKSGTALSFKVEDFIRWAVDSAKNQNYQLQLPDHLVSLEETILPPDVGELRAGSGAGFEQAGYIPRTRYLMDLLTEMKLQYAVVDGTNTPEMIRQLSYKAFLLPQLGKMVLVCDEEGNATYLVNNVRGERNWQQFINLKKSQLRNLADQGEVVVVSYQGDSELWKQRVSELLSAEELLVNERNNADNITDQESVLSVEEIPEGWLSRQELLDLLGRDYEWITTREQRVVKQGGEVVRHYKIGDGGKAKKYYSPEFVRSLVNESKKIKDAPTGWFTLRGLALELGKDRKWVEERIEVFRAVHPDWCRLYQNPVSHQVLEYLAPQIVSALRGGAETYKEAPVSWCNVRNMALELETSDATINHILSTLPTASEKYSGKYLDRSGRVGIFYHPAVVEAVREKLEGRALPVGFISVKSLVRETGVDEYVIHKLAERLMTPGSQEFRVIQVSPDFKKYGIHPDLAARIQSELAKRTFAPAGWMNRQELARVLERTPEWVDARVPRYLREHPEWMGKHMLQGTKRNSAKLVPYFSPEFISALVIENKEFELNKSVVQGEAHVSKGEKSQKQELNQGGWRSIAALAREGDGEHSYAFVQGLVEEYFGLHPELRESHEVKVGFQTSYSPEVSGYILTKLSEMKPAPAGWKSMASLEEELQRENSTIRKAAEEYLVIYPKEKQNFIAKRKMALHYGPNIVAALNERFSSLKKPPEGWLDRTALARTVGRSTLWVENRQKKVKLIHPEWFKNYLNQLNKSIEYSSPEFVAELKKEAGRE